MQTLKNSLAGAGAALFIMWALGALGVGHFYAYFGGEPISCVKGVK